MDIDETKYKADLELLTKHQNFTSEILRLSLLGIAVFGALLKLPSFSFDKIQSEVLVALTLFGFSTVFALAHRYYSNNGFENHIRYIRKPEKSIKSTRNKSYQASARFMLLACVCMGGGALALAFAFLFGAYNA